MPLTIPDQSIAASGKQPDVMNSLGSVMDFANKSNQNQLGKIAIQSNQANLNEENGVRSVMQNIKQYQDPQGNIDFNAIGPDIMKAAPTKGGAILAGLMGAQTASTGARQAAAGLNQTYKQQVAQEIGSMAGNGASPEQNVAQLDAMGKARPELAPIIDYMKSYTIGPALKSGDSKAMDQAFLHAATAIMSPGEQVQANTPSGIQVSNGQQTEVVNTAPLAGPIGAPIAGTQQQQQLPPTAPVMGGPGGTTPGYMGPQPSTPALPPSLGNIPPQWQKSADGERLQILQSELAAEKDPVARAALQREINRAQVSAGLGAQPAAKPGFVASGLPAGAAQGIVGTQEQINKHWTDTQTSAGTAQQDIGVLQNIKQHAAGAATGVAADKQTLVAGIAGMLGMDKGELAKTNADLLAKNSNMLALAGGDTNLARTMAEAATPNSHMTKEAIMQAADQVIGQRRLSLARAQFLTPFKAMADQGHPEMYNNALNQFNSVADPKVIQFESMSPAEAKAMIGSMSAQDRAEFRAKLSKAISLGIAK